MPYKLFRKGGRFCTKNIRTGKVICYKDEATRTKMIKLKEAWSHGWRGPTRVSRHARVSKRGRTHGVKNHWRRKR